MIASLAGSICGPPPEKLITSMPSRTADFERGDDLRRVAHVTDGRRDVEDPVVADLRPRRHTGQSRRLRVVRAGGCGRARVAGRDSRDVRAVERGLRVERQTGLVVRAGADEGARDDHLRRRPFLAALREARRVAVALRGEESVRRIDAVVDDRDLHSLAACSAARCLQRARADQAGTAVEREGVAVARVELARERELRRPRQLGRRQLHGHAVEQDRVVPPDRRLGDRALQRRGGGPLRALELRDIRLRRQARRVQPAAWSSRRRACVSRRRAAGRRA